MPFGQGDDHAAAVRLAGFGVDVAAVQVDDPAGDGEAEAGAAVARRARRVEPVEALEDAGRVGFGDAGALVEDLDHDAAVVAAGAHLDGAAARGVAHRVLEQVGDDLVHALGVAVGGEVAGLDVHRDRDGGLVQLLLAHRVLEQRLDAELGALERHRARLEPGQVEELLHEPAEPLDLGEHRAERLGIGLGDAVDEVLEHRLQRGDRRAQLVRHVGDEVAAHAVGLGELGGHLVERAGELADLVARGRGDPPARSRPWPSRRRRRPSRAAATSCPARGTTPCPSRRRRRGRR